MGHRFQVAEEGVVGVCAALLHDAQCSLRPLRCQVRALTLRLLDREDLVGARSSLELVEKGCLTSLEVVSRGP